jgi:glycosyltransferase involved in cell wall biosynthesis
VFRNATAVEVAWEGITKDAFGKYDDLDKSKFHHIPNGYDSSDFPSVNYSRNDKFTLTYTGSLYGRRNPKSLFEAIEKLIAEGKVNKDDLRFVFVGRFGDEVLEMFAEASFSDCIEKVGYVAHSESISYLLQSEALLLIVDEAKESEEIVPGKVYEYLGTKRPLFAIAPNSSAIAQLIRETEAGLIAHQSEIDKIADNFLAYYEAWKDGTALMTPNHSAIEQYERRNATKSLAELLDTLIKNP